jgi:hypothetical protein
MSKKTFDALTTVVGVLLVLAIIGGVFGIRLLIAGGDMGCVFSADPALCVAVKQLEGD